MISDEPLISLYGEILNKKLLRCHLCGGKSFFFFKRTFPRGLSIRPRTFFLSAGSEILVDLFAPGTAHLALGPHAADGFSDTCEVDRRALGIAVIVHRIFLRDTKRFRRLDRIDVRTEKDELPALALFSSRSSS